MVLYAATCRRSSEAITRAAVALLRDDMQGVTKHLDVADSALDNLPIDLFADLVSVDGKPVRAGNRQRTHSLGDTFEQLPER